MKTKSTTRKRIPPPPGAEAGYDAIIEYYSKYDWDDLERAGYLEEPSPEQVAEAVALTIYKSLCRNGIRIRLGSKDYEQLSKLAACQDISAEDLVKQWIKDRIQ